MRNRFVLYGSILFLALGAVNLAFAGGISFTFQTIDFPGATQTVAAGVNNSGQIVGVYQLADGSLHGFLDSGGVFTTVDDPTRLQGRSPRA